MRSKVAAEVSGGVALVVCILCSTAVSGSSLLSAQQPGRLLLSESDHKYELHDVIKLYANKVGPFSNPR